jgi:hypothetical protein
VFYHNKRQTQRLLIRVRVIQIGYDHSEGVLNEIIEGKTVFDQLVRKDLEGE